MSITFLPDDVLISIASCCAVSSLSDVHNLRLVCKKFRAICDDCHVLFRLSLEEDIFYPSWGDPQNFYRRYQRLRINGNPEALHRLGIICYFIDNDKDEGLILLGEASRRGFLEVMFLYGVILICRGGLTKQKGIEILSSFVKPLMSQTIEDLEGVRGCVERYLVRGGQAAMSELKGWYAKEKCECDGKTRNFLSHNNIWHRYGADDDMNTSSACQFCLSDHEVELLLDGIK